jgi:hypothetical protein
VVALGEKMGYEMYEHSLGVGKGCAGMVQQKAFELVVIPSKLADSDA